MTNAGIDDEDKPNKIRAGFPLLGFKGTWTRRLRQRSAQHGGAGLCFVGAENDEIR